MSLTPHPDRPSILAELYTRPFTAVPIPYRLLQFAFQVSPADAEDDRVRMEALARGGSSQAAGSRTNYDGLLPSFGKDALEVQTKNPLDCALRVAALDKARRDYLPAIRPVQTLHIGQRPFLGRKDA